MMHSGFGSGFGHFGNWLCWPGAFFPGPLGWIVTVLFWGLILYLVIRLVHLVFPGGKGKGTVRLDALKERYARGEINEDEYQRMKAELC